MTHKPLTLSIVIPAFNEQDFLPACLDSIAAQTVMPDEVIVVDNNSSDKTSQIANSYPFVKLINLPERSRSTAQKAGFDTATSELIGRIDADTILPRDWVRNVKHLYKELGAPELLAVSAPSAFRNRFGLIWFVMHRLTYFWPCRLLMGHNTLVGSNMFITSKLWKQIQGLVCLRDDFHEDMDLALHAVRIGAQVLFSKDIKASIMGRRMLARAIEYPLMMWRVLTAAEHSPTGFNQPINQRITSPEYYPSAYEE